MGNSNSTCSTCGDNVPGSTDGMNKHMESEHFEIFCNFCRETFTTMSVKDYHMVKIHVECKECEKYFENRQTLEQHKLTHRPPPQPTLQKYKCSQCPRQFSTIEQTRTHILEHFECPRCSLQLYSAEELKEHIKIHTINSNSTPQQNRAPFQASSQPAPQKYKCPECSNTFSTVEESRSHLLAHYKCPRCSVQATSKEQLIEHYQNNHTNQVNSNTSVRSSTRSTAQQPPPQPATQIYECPECSRQFSTRELAIRHILEHYKCPQCSTQLRSLSELDDHLRSHQTNRSSSNSTPQQPSQRATQIYECNQCSRQFSTSEQARTHILEHFKCSRCSTQLYSLDQYNEHYRNCNTNPNNTRSSSNVPNNNNNNNSQRSSQRQQQQRVQEQCEKCGSRFSSKEEKNEHLEKVHHNCSSCSKEFLNKYEMRKHALMAHPYCLLCEHPQEYDPSHKAKRYAKATDLLNHVEQYHSIHFIRPRRFFSNFKCVNCRSGWKSALTWGKFLPYPRNHPRYENPQDDDDDEDDYNYYYRRDYDDDDDDDDDEDQDDDYDDYDNDELGVFNNRLRFQTRDEENELGEIFIFFPQECRNCKTSCMPFKCTYLTCSRCKQDVRECECSRGRKKSDNYNDSAPHRQDLCARCKHLGHGCWKQGIIY